MTGRGEPLSLAHRHFLAPLLSSLAVPLSEFSFANLYLFRASHRWELVRDPVPFLRGATYAGEPFALPLFDPRGAEPGPLAAAARETGFLFPIPEGWLGAFPEGRWKREARRGDSDYLYRMRTMCGLPGPDLHGKRNLVSRFTRRYRHELRRLAGAEVPAALEVLDRWLAGSGQEVEETDYGPCREGLAKWAELGLSGWIAWADGKPAGFALGEGVTADTFALHFAKGDKRFAGVYQYLFSGSSCLLKDGYEYLNLEQDLDRETLRAAKQSYHPERLLPKYRVSLAG